jgi:hypothetical protein
VYAGKKTETAIDGRRSRELGSREMDFRFGGGRVERRKGRARWEEEEAEEAVEVEGGSGLPSPAMALSPSADMPDTKGRSRWKGQVNGEHAPGRTGKRR